MDAFKGFGGAITGLLMFAAGRTHTPAAAAASSMAQFVTASNQNNMTDYEKHYQQWKDQTDEALKLDAAHRGKVNEALELMKTNMAAGQAMLAAADAEYHDEQGTTMGLAQLWTQRAELGAARERLSFEMSRSAGDIEQQKLLANSVKALRQAQQTGDTSQIARTEADVAFAKNPTNTFGRPGTPQFITQQIYDQIKRDKPETSDADAWTQAEERQKSATGKPSAAVIAQTEGPDGTPAYTLAQQLPNGQWVTADEKREPIPGVKATMKADQVPPANDPSVSKTAKMIAKYQIPPLTGWVMKTPWGQAVVARSVI